MCQFSQTLPGNPFPCRVVIIISIGCLKGHGQCSLAEALPEPPLGIPGCSFRKTLVDGTVIRRMGDRQGRQQHLASIHFCRGRFRRMNPVRHERRTLGVKIQRYVERTLCRKTVDRAFQDPHFRLCQGVGPIPVDFKIDTLRRGTGITAPNTVRIGLGNHVENRAAQNLPRKRRIGKQFVDHCLEIPCSRCFAGMHTGVNPHPALEAVRNSGIREDQHFDRTSFSAPADPLTSHERRTCPLVGFGFMSGMAVRQEISDINRVVQEIFIDCLRQRTFTCIEAQVFLPVVRIKRPHHLGIGNTQKHQLSLHPFQAKMEPAAAGQKGRIDGIEWVDARPYSEAHHLQRIFRGMKHPHRIDPADRPDAARIEIGRDGYLRRNISPNAR